MRDFHLEPMTYSVDDSAMKEFISVDDELRKIDKKANNGYGFVTIYSSSILVVVNVITKSQNLCQKSCMLKE